MTTHSPLSAWFYDDIIFEKIFDGLDFLIVGLDAFVFKIKNIENKGSQVILCTFNCLESFL